MYEERISTIPKYLEKLSYYSGPFWIFRGHANVSWKLTPSAGRAEYYSESIARDNKNSGEIPFDLVRFEEWRKAAYAYNNNLPANDFECLALAQHFGLATRLLDWSTNPLIALFFAIESCTAEEGCVYLYAPDIVIDPYIISLLDPTVVCNYMPPPLDNRILAQQGEFTYHPYPNEELEPGPLPDAMLVDNPYKHDTNLIRFLIAPELKRIIKRELDIIGINRKYLFADLDGLSNYVNWGTSFSVFTYDLGKTV